MWTSNMSAGLVLLRVACLSMVGLMCGATVIGLARVRVLEAPRFGLRGKRRKAARLDLAFRLLEPWLLRLGGLMASVPLGQRRYALECLAIRAGRPLGACADEWLALSLLSWLVLGVGGAALTVHAGMNMVWTAIALVLAALTPVAHLRQAARERAKQLERSLPTAMDLCVLCMGAGSDFPGALRFVVAEIGAAHLVCQEELSQVLDELSLGRTRVEALSALAERSDSPAVRDFVAAVCQSETKGTPLVNALGIQAGSLRQRRSVLAEEAAARAGVQMMLPMMLTVVCIVLIVIGPFVVNGMGM